DSTDLLGRPEEIAPADQPLDRETELELPCASFLHAHREPLDGARGQERPGSLAYALRGGAAVGDRAQHRRLGDSLERLQCELGGACAYVLVRLALYQPVELFGVFELLDGDPPNPRVRIAPRDRFQARLIAGAHLPYRRHPNLGVGATPAGPEVVEDLHRAGP